MGHRQIPHVGADDDAAVVRESTVDSRTSSLEDAASLSGKLPFDTRSSPENAAAGSSSGSTIRCLTWQDSSQPQAGASAFKEGDAPATCKGPTSLSLLSNWPFVIAAFKSFVGVTPESAHGLIVTAALSSKAFVSSPGCKRVAWQAYLSLKGSLEVPGLEDLARSR